MRKLIYATGLFLMVNSYLYSQVNIEITAEDVVDHLQNNPEGITIRIVRYNFYQQIIIRWPGTYGKLALDGRLVTGSSITTDVKGIQTELTGDRTSQMYETTIYLGNLNLGDFFGTPYISRRVQIGRFTASECVDGFWTEFNDPLAGNYGYICFNSSGEIVVSDPLPLYLELADPRNFELDANFAGDNCYAPEPEFGDFLTGGLTNLYTSKELDIILQSRASYRETNSCAPYAQCWVIDRTREGEGDIYARGLFTFSNSDWDNLSSSWEYDYPIDGSYTKIGSIRERPPVDAGGNEEYCAGTGTQQLSAVTSGGVWSDEEGYVSENGIFETDLTPAGNYTVHYTVTDGFGCTATDSKVVTINSPPTINVQDMSVCSESGVVGLNAKPSGGIWSGSSYIDGSNFNTTEAPVGDYNLTYTVTDMNGCQSSAVMKLTINALPEVNAGDNMEVCSTEEQATLFGATPAGGTWSGEHVSGEIFYINDAGVGDHLVYYSVKDENGCEAIDSKIITVNPTPTADAGDDLEMCIGDVIELSGSAFGGNGAYTYSWSPDKGLDEPEMAQTVASPEEDITYTLTVTDQKGCSAIDNINITVNSLPDIILTADGTITESIALCPGESADFNATGGINYLWDPIAGLNNPYINNPVASPLESTIYTVTVTGDKGCIGQKSIDVTIKAPPKLSMGAALQLCANDAPYDLRQDVNISGGMFNGQGVEGVFFYPEDVSPNVYTISYEIISDGCPVTAYREVQVNALPATTISADQKICRGETVGLNTSGGIDYEWSPTNGLNNAFVSNPVAGPLENTTYQVAITDGNGCIVTEEVAVTVQAPKANAGTNVTICSGEETILSASGGEDYKWAPATGLNDEGVKDPVASPGSTTTYTVTVSDSEGCEDSDEVTVTVNTPPEVDAGAPLILCQSDAPYDLRQDVNIDGGIFGGDAVEGVLIKPALLDPDIYFITYTVEENGCTNSAIREVEILKAPVASVVETHIEMCPNQAVQLQATGGINYSWFPHEGLDDPNLANPTASPIKSTLYTVTVSNASGCISQETVYVEILETTIDAGIDVSICVGNTVQLSAQGGQIYSWKPTTGLSNANVRNPLASPEVTTIYTVNSIDEYGCHSSDKVTVTVNPGPELIVGEPLNLCKNSEPYDLRQDVNIPGGVFEGEGVDGVLLRPQEMKEGIYFIDYTVESSGCTMTAQREVIIHSLPEVTIEQDQILLCKGDSVQLQVSGGSEYLWEESTSLSDLTIANPYASPTVSTTYKVHVLNDNQCSTTEQVTVVVTEADASAGGDVQICPGKSVMLSASGGEAYRWSPASSLSVYNTSNPQASPDSTTSYTVMVTDQNGCQDSAKVMVTVKDLEPLDAGAPLSLCENSEPYDLRQDVNIPGGVFEGEGVDGVLLRPQEMNEGIYFIHYTVESSGCTVTAQREVIIHSLPEVTIEQDQILICKGDSIQLQVSGGSNYLWEEASTLNDLTIANPYASPTVSTTYKVHVLNDNQCSTTEQVTVVVTEADASAGGDVDICPGESVMLSASGGEAYQWSPTSSLSVYNTSTPQASPDSTTSYTVMVTDQNGCQDSAKVTVTVKDLELLDAGAPLSLCKNSEPYDLRQDVNIPGGVFEGEGVDGVLLRPQEMKEGIYFIDYTVESSGCTVTAQREVIIHSLPEATIEQNQILLCKGDSIQLQVSGGSDYLWEDNVSLSDITIANPYASPTASTTYKVHVINDNQCSTTEQVTVVVTEADASAGGNVDICPGESVMLSASGGEAYRWSPASSLSVYNTSTPQASPDSTTSYTVMVTDQNGCQDSAKVTVTVTDLELLDAGAPLSLCENSEPYNLRQDVNIPGGVFEGEDVDGVLLRPQEMKEGIYFIDYTVESSGCEVTAQREVVIKAIPELNIKKQELLICPGDSVRLSVTGGESYSWSPSTGLSDFTVANPLAAPSEPTQYTVIVTNGENCHSTGIVEVAIDNIKFDAGGDFDLCINALPVQLPMPQEGGSWQGRGIVNNVLDPISAGTGEVTAKFNVLNKNKCLLTDSIVVSILEEPSLLVGEALEVCRDDSPIDLLPDVNFTGGEFEGTGMTGSLFDPGKGEKVNIITYSVRYHGCALQGFREILVNEPTNLQFGEDLELCVNSDPYPLNNDVNILGGEISGAYVLDDHFYPDSVGNFVVSYSFINGYGCISSANKMVNVVAPITVDAGQDQSLCNTVESIDLSSLANPSGGIYSGNHVTENAFEAKGLSAGDYKVDYVYDNGNGCISNDSLIITIIDSPIADFGQDTLICIGTDPVELNFSEELFTGGWTGNGVVNNSFIGSLAGEGRHLLTYRNENVACDIVGTRAITVVGSPAFARSELSEVAACTGDYVMLTASLPESEVNKYTTVEWFEDAVKLGTGRTLFYQVTEDTKIHYKSVSSFNCASDQESFVTISTDNPSGEIAVSDTTPIFGRPVQFHVQNAKNVKSYFWDFGDGMTSYEEKPWHFYYQSDTFSITLVLTSNSGCETQVVSDDLVVVGPQPGTSDPDALITSIQDQQDEYLFYEGPLQILALFPHPVEDEVTVALVTSRAGKYKADILDFHGIPLQRSEIDLKNGYNEADMLLNNLENGMYILRIMDDKEQVATKLYKL